MISEIKESIIKQLSINSNLEIDEDFIEEKINDYLKIASDKSHRTIEDERLIPYVKNAVIMAYGRLGDESVSSSSEGSQNYSFIDIEEKLARDVIAIRKLM